MSVHVVGYPQPACGYSTASGTLTALRGTWYGRVQLVADIGYPTVPEDLRAWACVLAGQQLVSVEELGTLTAGGVTAAAIDDSRTGYTDSGEGVGLSLPDRVVQQLRAAYASSVHVTGP